MYTHFCVNLCFSSLGFIPRSIIAVSYNNPLAMVSVRISPCPHEHLLLSAFVILVILARMKWHLMLILICIPLMTNAVEHCFMCLLTICTSLEKCLFKSFAHFKIRLCMSLLSCKIYLYILDTRPLSKL